MDLAVSVAVVAVEDDELEISMMQLTDVPVKVSNFVVVYGVAVAVVVVRLESVTLLVSFVLIHKIL